MKIDATRTLASVGLRGKSILKLGLLVCLSLTAIHLWQDTTDPYYDRLVEQAQHVTSSTSRELSYRRLQQSVLAKVEEEHEDLEDEHNLAFSKNITACGRATLSPKAKALPPTFLKEKEGGNQEYEWAQCPSQFDPDTPTLVLEGYETYGRTGNHLYTFFNALQLVRDAKYQLAIMYNSWALGVIVQFFFASNDDDWERRIEEALCIKIIHDVSELQGWRVVLKSNEFIFRYRSLAPPEEKTIGQLRTLRNLFGNYNYGEGTNQFGDKVKDMCSGINHIFGKENEGRAVANYTVIHLRHLEGPPGLHILGQVAKRTGCDPVAALQMSPSYVKSILEPLGMLDKPIVVITDGQSKEQLDGLISDPEIGPMLRLRPKKDPAKISWFGGDVMLAVMANIFIGNPASTMSGFIVRSRVALGFEGSNYLYRAKDKHGKWGTVCGDNCLFNIDLPDQDTAEATKETSLSVQDDTEPTFQAGPLLKLNKREGRITIAQLTQERKSVGTSQELKELARKSRVYTGLHPDDLAKKIHSTSP